MKRMKTITIQYKIQHINPETQKFEGDGGRIRNMAFTVSSKSHLFREIAKVKIEGFVYLHVHPRDKHKFQLLPALDQRGQDDARHQSK